jgi:hypothetical protein
VLVSDICGQAAVDKSHDAANVLGGQREGAQVCPGLRYQKRGTESVPAGVGDGDPLAGVEQGKKSK